MSRQSAKKASIAEWDALLARYPLGSPWEVARQLTIVVGGNAVVLYLLFTGQMRPFDLVALVALEAVILTAIAWVQSLPVPRSALMEKPQPLRARLFLLGFGAVWLGFVYGIVLGGLLDSADQLVDAVRHPLAMLGRDALFWPLLITLTFGLVDAARDWLHWRAAGGYFLSTPGFNSAARWLTLFLGGIPFFVPLAASVLTIATLAGRLGKRAGGGSGRAGASGLAAIVAPVLMFSLFGLMGLLFQAGVSGWAVGYCSAKLASESFLVFLPLIASKARAEEAAGVPATNRKRAATS